MTVIVINELVFTDAPQQDQGITEGYVYNGDWTIVIDWTDKLLWPKKYPDTKSPVMSVRPAVKGECLPYY